MHKPYPHKANLQVDTICLAALIGIAAIGAVHALRYLLLGMALPLVTICLVEVLFALVSLLAWQGKCPAMLLVVGIPALILGCMTNYVETTLFNFGYFLQAGIAIFAAVIGTILSVRSRNYPRWPNRAIGVATVLLVAGTVAVWLTGTTVSQTATTANRTIWSVPVQYDVACEKSGTVEAFAYQTKAYATDQRSVEKTAYVYLPHDYDPLQPYNILYLMHGTGDNEASWLLGHPENRNMVDQMIAAGVIEPLIIVTPTFYVEDDCTDNLDALTYSFAEELRNDLMPAVESAYSTFTESCDGQGFTASRDHRAFAGLSRGAVTTYHSAMCNSLDYFSRFGTFSGSRTTADYFRQTIQTEELVNYPIHYLYASSGTFDFALPGQIQDYKALVAIEPRLTVGRNTSFDIFPMRYHSWENWHLALYNFLQEVF